MPNIYQGLLWYNGSSTTTFVPVLAQSWTVSSNGMNYTFNLRTNVHFSNGDPFNAYVMWYSIYRVLFMNQGPSWILEQNLGTGSITTNMLNTFDFSNPTQSQLAVMQNSSNSVQVINASTIQFNLGQGFNGPNPYPGFLASLTVPTASAVDPTVITANGGVVANSPNTWATNNAIGTGQFDLSAWNHGQNIILVKDPNYWGNNLPATQANAEITPAILDKVVINYKTNELTRELDLKSGNVQSAYIGYTHLADINGTSGIVVQALGLTTSINWVYMRESVAPFNNTLVREAVSYAINYSALIHNVLGGLGVPFVGPLFIGMPDYNSSIAPYQYNFVKAENLLAQAGYPNGTGLPQIQFLYLSGNDEDTQAATIIQADLSAIGMNVALLGEQYPVWASMQTEASAAAGAPAMGISHWSADFMSPDDYTVPLATSTGFLMQYLSGYNNTQLDGLIYSAAVQTNATQRAQMYSQITQIMKDNYVNIWFYQREGYAVYSTNVGGISFNPLGASIFDTHTYANIYLK